MRRHATTTFTTGCYAWFVRDGRWAPGDYPAYVFEARYRRHRMEFQVDVDLGDLDAARAEVEIFAPVFGQMPQALMAGINEVEIEVKGPTWAADRSLGVIHVGTEGFHAGSGRDKEELALHESAHVSWDPDHASSPGWREAQQEDPGFVSDYARSQPDVEDLAETAVAWFAVRYRPDRISPSEHEAILSLIPNRLAYLDRQGFDMSPYTLATPVPALPLVGTLLLAFALTGALAARGRSS